MRALDQYQQRGLREPIRVYPGFRFHLLLWGGGGFLLTGAVLMMDSGTGIEPLVGLFGLVFFGFACTVMLIAALRAHRRGVFELSEAGLYMAHLGIVLPWEDIGPAYIQAVRVKGFQLDDVCFVVRHASRHIARVGSVGRLLFKVAKAVSHSRKGGAIEWGLRAGLALTEAGLGTHRQMGSILERMRQAVLAEPDSLVFNVPMALRFGVPAEDLLAILNAEVLRRSGEVIPSHPAA
ncbi:hypothetical protein [Roseospira goensis]|uniref:Uncharacterized protein n=1 Tax=Roseospira goensis TaxID=391922 RepID=A0A7W6S219_9PROT|nr:hypothetical protein [Roseospira goensis]MBB4286737.1 hypothetical protein [Roseospira goensis]